MNIYGSTTTSSATTAGEPSPVVYYQSEGANDEAKQLLPSNEDRSPRPRTNCGDSRSRVTGFAAVAVCVILATVGSSSFSTRSIFQNDELLEAMPKEFTLADAPTYILNGGGEGGGTCPSGLAVSKEDCYEVAKKLGEDAGITNFANDELNVGTWDFAPCGCFIWDNSWIDWKEPVLGSCATPKKGQLICQEPPPPAPAPGAAVDAQLYPKGEGNGQCKAGKEISEDQCNDTARKLAADAGFTNLRPEDGSLNPGSWYGFPCGCFIYHNTADGTQWIDYKDPAKGNCGAESNSQIICMPEDPIPPNPNPEPSDYYILEPGEGEGTCPAGQEVPKDECYDAAREVGLEAGLSNMKDFLNEGTWANLPCGCFIYVNEWIDYKDPSAGTCKADANSRQVCKKLPPTTAPTAAPTPPPTAEPTAAPTPPPTAEPTAAPTPPPTAKPTADPNHACGTDNCQCSCHVSPDPHYMTWSAAKFDFQGGCDQIAIDNFNMQVQFRTRPRGRYSIITEVGILFKATKETFIYKIMPNGSFVSSNKLTDASATVKSQKNGFRININPKNFILLTKVNKALGIRMQIRGGGAYMFGSQGTCGSWNDYGNRAVSARYKDGTVYKTRGNYWTDRNNAFPMIKSWMVPIESSILTNPSNICDASNKCGPGQAFQCNDVGQSGPVVPGCKEKNCNRVQPKAIREECEEDVKLTGDATFACKYLEDEFLPIYYPKCVNPKSAKVVCGSTIAGNQRECRKNYGVTEKNVSGSSKWAVRCCSEKKLPGFIKTAGCSVWGDSEVNGKCYSKKTYCEAEELCESIGARLCTRAEIVNKCTEHSGCNFNWFLIWTKD